MGSNGSSILAGNVYGNYSSGNSSESAVFSVIGWVAVKVMMMMMMMWSRLFCYPGIRQVLGGREETSYIQRT